MTSESSETINEPITPQAALVNALGSLGVALHRCALRPAAATSPGCGKSPERASRQHVVSPNGAWLLVAVCAGADPGTERLETFLGMPATQARTLLSDLLAHPHPELRAALAAWMRNGVGTQRSAEFMRGLPQGTATGDIPTQPEADAWAKERTDGLIEHFPGDLTDPALLLVLASAVVSRLTWGSPWQLCNSRELGEGPFSAALEQALTVDTATSRAHSGWLVNSDHGPMAVHCVDGGNEVRVYSVIAEASVPAEHVLQAAYRVAAEPWEGRISLFDVPMESPLWQTTERTYTKASWDERVDFVSRVTLPAWRAETVLDLMSDPSLGFTAAATVVAALLDAPQAVTATQSTVAQYGRDGFDAAALTSIMTRMSSREPEPCEVVERTAHIRFPHPYAVVAVASSPEPRDDEPASLDVDEAWIGAPLFSAWIDEPNEPDA